MGWDSYMEEKYFLIEPARRVPGFGRRRKMPLTPKQNAWVCALVAVLMGCGRLYAEKFAHVVKPERKFLLSDWLKARIKSDRAIVAKDRLELRHLAGRSGVASQRSFLLRQIGSYLREIRDCKQNKIPHFPSIVYWGSRQRCAYRLSPGDISRLNDNFVVTQILGPHSALCVLSCPFQYDNGWLMYSPGQRLPGYQKGPGRMVKIDGLDFSSLTVGMDISVRGGLCQAGKPYTYKTVTGATNTVAELHPIRMVNDTKRH